MVGENLHTMRGGGIFCLPPSTDSLWVEEALGVEIPSLDLGSPDCPPLLLSGESEPLPDLASGQGIRRHPARLGSARLQKD